MLIKHHMDIGRSRNLNDINAFQASQMLGSHKDLTLFKVKSGLVISDQNPVVGADHHIAFGQIFTQGTLTDKNRPQMFTTGEFFARHRTGPYPANFLNTVVTGNYTITNLKILYLTFAFRGRDQGSRREARDDFLDVGKVQSPGLGTRCIGKHDSAVNTVVRAIPIYRVTRIIIGSHVIKVVATAVQGPSQIDNIVVAYIRTGTAVDSIAAVNIAERVLPVIAAHAVVTGTA